MELEPSNPLNSDLLQFIAQTDLPLSEYELLQQVRQHPLLETLATENADLQLFRQHFVLMNSLYQLRAILWPFHYELNISALAITLTAHDESGQTSSSEAIDRYDALASYYLDWQVLNETDEDDVERLLNNFWKGFAGIENQDAALAELGLTSEASAEEITRQYRKLALQYHPDRGGNSDKFQKITEAYQQLKA